MSAILLLVEAVSFAAAGAFVLAPWPWWTAAFALLVSGLCIAISRDADTAEAAKADLEADISRDLDWRDFS